MTKEQEKMQNLIHNTQMVMRINNKEEGEAFGDWAYAHKLYSTGVYGYGITTRRTYTSDETQLISFGGSGSLTLRRVESADKGKVIVDWSDFAKDPEYYAKKYKEDNTVLYIIMAIILAPIIFLIGWVFCGLWEITDGDPFIAIIGALLCIKLIK